MSMTVEEAIERLKQEARNKRADADWKWRHGRLNSDDLIESAENIEQLAKWLEEIQQYRAIIGLTPEDLKALEKDEIQTIGDALKAFAEWSQYIAIGTVSEFRELKEKATAKKPIETEEFTEGGWIGKCPTCGSDCNDAMNYCDQCGQRLLWD